MTEEAIAHHLHLRLAETAEKLRQDEVLTDHAIATAFMAVAATVARHAHGPVATAEWLRDVADAFERETLDGGPLPGSLH